MIRRTTANNNKNKHTNNKHTHNNNKNKKHIRRISRGNNEDEQ